MSRTLLVTAFFPPRLGGLEHYWAQVAQRWPAGQLTVLAPPVEGARKDERDRSYEIIRQPFFSLRGVRPSWLPMIRSVRGIVRNRGIARILFGHFANYALVGPLLKRLNGVRYDVMSHGVDSVLPTQSRFGRFALRFVLNQAAKIFANSHQTSIWLRFQGARSVIVAPPAIDFSSFPELEQAQARQKTQLKDKFTVLSFGRLVDVKGVDILLRALSLTSDASAYQAVIAGDGPERRNLERLAHSLGLPDGTVRFAGEIPDRPEEKAAWYAAADLFVLSSRVIGDRRESFGLVGLEAARYRLPVVVTSVSGATEYVRNEETGYVIPPENPSALAKMLDYCRVHREQARAYGQALHNAVVSTYTWERTVDVLSGDD